jgi:hypothetical protein
MGKKDKRESTIENRVYLFKDLAAAFLAEHGAMLGSTNASEAARGRRALAEIARASCLVADTEGLTADEVAELVARAPTADAGGESAPKRAPKKRGRTKGKSAEPATKKGRRSAKKRRGRGGGRGGG